VSKSKGCLCGWPFCFSCLAGFAPLLDGRFNALNLQTRRSHSQSITTLWYAQMNFSRGQEGTGSLGHRESLVPCLDSAVIHHFGSLKYELSSEIAIIQGRMGNPTTTLDSRDARYT